MHQPMRPTLVELFWKPQCYHFSRGGWGVWRDGGPVPKNPGDFNWGVEALAASSAGATLRYLDLRGLAAAPPYGDGKSVTQMWIKDDGTIWIRED